DADRRNASDPRYGHAARSQKIVEHTAFPLDLRFEDSTLHEPTKIAAEGLIESDGLADVWCILIIVGDLKQIC
ncbi:MAG: hypothetical protein ABJA02_03120, partial [Acidobacteriota bacterium]